MEAGVIPIKTAEFDHPAGPRFVICDQFLVLNFEKTVRRQHTAPMRHQSEILTVKRQQIAAIVGEIYSPLDEPWLGPLRELLSDGNQGAC